MLQKYPEMNSFGRVHTPMLPCMNNQQFNTAAYQYKKILQLISIKKILQLINFYALATSGAKVCAIAH